MAGVLDCSIGTIPFSYLGIRVGMNYRRIDEWSHLMHKVKVRMNRITLTDLPYVFLLLTQENVERTHFFATKWVWRFFSDKNGLCARVIHSLHGDIALGEGGIVSNSIESNWSNWWCDVVGLGRVSKGR